MQTRALTVPKGKDLVVVWVSNQNYVLVTDASGSVRSLSQSEGKHITLALEPGRYVLETDGRLKQISFQSLEPRLRAPRAMSAERPPRPRGRRH